MCPYSDPETKRQFHKDYAALRRMNKGKKMQMDTFVAIDSEGADISGKRMMSYIPTATNDVSEECEVSYHRTFLWGAAGESGSIAWLVPSGKSRCITSYMILDWLLTLPKKFPRAIFVMFATGYDWAQIFADLPRDHVLLLHNNGDAVINEYRVRYIKGKKLVIQKGRISITIFDVFGFFQTSFVASMQGITGSVTPEEEALIVKGKANRNNLSFDMVEDIKYYTSAELRVLCRMMRILRGGLQDMGLILRSWHGAGAIASSMMTLHEVRQHYMEVFSDNIPWYQQWSHVSYAGGRIELLKQGKTDKRLYEYDINSAYPYACSLLPSMKGGEFYEVSGLSQDHMLRLLNDASCLSMAVVKAGSEVSSDELFCGHGERPCYPLFYREDSGKILFPPVVYGCYIKEEILQAFAWKEKMAASSYDISIEKLIIFKERIFCRPFSFVNDYYLERLRIKREIEETGEYDIREKVIKLGLNAIYGKLAQSAGHRISYACPYYAAFITAFTRARLMEFSFGVPQNSIVAFMTDGIITTTRHSEVALGGSLGDWSLTVHNSGGIFVKSGIYELFGAARKKRTRGISIPREALRAIWGKVLTAWGSLDYNAITYPYRYYVTPGLSLRLVRHDLLGCWISTTRRMVCQSLGFKRTVALTPKKTSALTESYPVFAEMIKQKLPLSAPSSPEWLDDSAFSCELDKDQFEIEAR